MLWQEHPPKDEHPPTNRSDTMNVGPGIGPGRGGGDLDLRDCPPRGGHRGHGEWSRRLQRRSRRDAHHLCRSRRAGRLDGREGTTAGAGAHGRQWSTTRRCPGITAAFRWPGVVLDPGRHPGCGCHSFLVATVASLAAGLIAPQPVVTASVPGSWWLSRPRRRVGRGRWPDAQRGLRTPG